MKRTEHFDLAQRVKAVIEEMKIPYTAVALCIMTEDDKVWSVVHGSTEDLAALAYGVLARCISAPVSVKPSAESFERESVQ